MLEPSTAELAGLPTTQLTSYIVHRHHRFARLSLPAVQRLSVEVARREPRLRDVVGCVDTLAGALLSHMFSEERFLFPAMAACPTSSARVREELSDCDEEHRLVASLLDEVHGFSTGGTVTEIAPALAARLQRFEIDTRRHLAIERDVLQPRFAFY